MADTFYIVQRVLFFGLIVAATALFLWMLRDFALPVFWAVVFAIVLYPGYLGLRAHVTNPSAAALVAIAGVLAIVFVPLYFLAILVAHEAVELYREITTRGPAVIGALQDMPAVQAAMDAIGIDVTTIREYVVESVRAGSSWLGTEALFIGQATFTTVIKTLLMLYLLFFLLRDGERILGTIKHALPLGSARESLLFARFTRATRSMFKGTVLVSVLQGVAGGILFWIAGVENAVLWGVVMGIAAIIPAIGPGIVWLPAGIILLALGATWQGIFVLVGGMVLVSLLDNVLRPILVGRETHMPDALVLLAIFGGLASFGIAGIIVGPVIAALFLAVWALFTEEYETELTERG